MRKSNFIQKIVDNLWILDIAEDFIDGVLLLSSLSELDKLFRLYDTLLDLNNNNLSKYFQSRTLVYYMTLRDKLIDYFSPIDIYIQCSYRQIKKTFLKLCIFQVLSTIYKFLAVLLSFATNYHKSIILPVYYIREALLSTKRNRLLIAFCELVVTNIT